MTPCLLLIVAGAVFAENNTDTYIQSACSSLVNGLNMTELVSNKLPMSIEFWTPAGCPGQPNAYSAPYGYIIESCSTDNGKGTHCGCADCIMSKIKLMFDSSICPNVGMGGSNGYRQYIRTQAYADCEGAVNYEYNPSGGCSFICYKYSTPTGAHVNNRGDCSLKLDDTECPLTIGDTCYKLTSEYSNCTREMGEKYDLCDKYLEDVTSKMAEKSPNGTTFGNICNKGDTIGPPDRFPSCGAADGLAVETIPNANLCERGTPSAVTGSGPWEWSCNLNNTYTTFCQAPIKYSNVEPSNNSSAASGSKGGTGLWFIDNWLGQINKNELVKALINMFQSLFSQKNG